MSRFKLSELELDALQETMNISFGSAAADLAEVMDIFVHLTVPDILSVSARKLPEYINSEITDFSTSSVVEQKYYGDFKGIAFLVFPFGNEKELLSYFNTTDTEKLKSDQLLELESEVLMELGNILLGACIGRIFEMLESNIHYDPPLIMTGKDFDQSFIESEMDSRDLAITMKTCFSFEDRDTKGYLVLINSQESVPHLKKALSRFIGA